MLLEFVAPGLVVVFMGASAVIVAGLNWLGVLSSLTSSFATWMGLSVVLVVALRNVIMKYIPADVRRDESNEFADALGQVVEVLEPCGPDHMHGRIKYQGTSWPARTVGDEIPAGGRARLLFRDNLNWTVEAVHELPPVEPSANQIGDGE